MFSRTTMDDVKKVAKSSCNDGVLLRMGLNDNKAGMEGLDKEKINRIIMEATKVVLITFFLVLYLWSSIVRPSSSLPQILSLTCLYGWHLFRRNSYVGRKGRGRSLVYFRVLLDSSRRTWRRTAKYMLKCSLFVQSST